jgi:hypothetical protein
MALSSLASEALGGIARVVFEVFVEYVFHGTGRAILASRGSRDTSDAAFTLVGAVFWIGIVAVGVGAWSWLY